MVMKHIVNIAQGSMPFVKIFLLYSLGIVVARYFHGFGGTLWAWLIVLGILFVFTLVSYVRERKKLFPIGFYLFLFSLGIYQQVKQDVSTAFDNEDIANSRQLAAIIADEPIVKERSIRFPVKLAAGIDSVHSVSGSGKVMVTLLKDSTLSHIPKYGDHLIFENKLQPVPPPYNPKEFNYKKYLANQGIHQQVFLRSSDFMIIDTASRSWFSTIISLREYFVEKFRTNIHDDTAFGIASALVFGYRSEMDQATLTAFTNTGTIHVLSVSGLHVTLVFGLLTFLLRPIDRLRYGRSLRFAIILVTIWGYVVLTGMAPPILRAGIMISFFVVSSWIGRQQNNINTLVASAFFILLFSPRMLWDIGFQLSYAAMLGIFLIYPLLQKFYVPNNKILKPIVEYSYVSIAAQLTTAPAALYYFGQFPNYFLFANLIIALPTTIIMYAGVGLMLVPFDMPSMWLGWVVEHAVLLMYRSLQFIDRLPYSTFQGIDFHGLQLLVFIVLVAGLFYTINFRSKKALFGTMILSLGLAISFYMQFYPYQIFQGSKVYNVRRELAVVTIDRGRVMLFSTLDSLWDPALVYAVHADLKHYTRIKDVHFVKIPPDSTVVLDVLGQKMTFCQTNDCPTSEHELLLLRNNSRQLPSDIGTATKLIIDGSNSWRNVQQLKEQLGKDSVHSYVLKDNFAYVWVRE